MDTCFVLFFFLGNLSYPKCCEIPRPSAVLKRRCVVLFFEDAQNMKNMLRKRQLTQANRKLATTCTSGPDNPQLPARACVRTSVLQTATLRRKFRSETLRSAVPQKSYRLGVCFGARPHMKRSRALLNSLYSVRARPVSVGRWCAPPGVEIHTDVMRGTRVAPLAGFWTTCGHAHQMFASIF